MKRWLLLLLIIGVGIGGIFYPWGAKSPHKDEAKQLPLAANKGDTKRLAFVPADTVYYIGGHTIEAISEFMLNNAMMSSTPSQSQQLTDLFNIVGSSADSPPAKFFSHLFYKLSPSQNSNNRFTKLLNLTGLSTTGPFAFYSHGLVPVLRIELANTNTFNQLIEEAVTESGWQYQQEMLGNTKLRLWEIDDNNSLKFYFAMATSATTLTVTLITSEDDPLQKKQRLGLVKPVKSLTDTQEIEAIKTQYAFSNDFVGFFNFERLAQGLLNPETNAFGQQLLRYMPEASKAEFKANLPENCRHDYANLAANMPRMVFGYENLSLTNHTLHMSMSATLEINNAFINTELAKLRGHIPVHAMSAVDKLIHLGLGINIDNLSSVLTAMWTRFLEASFTCEPLVEAQEKARLTDPAMIDIFLGMAKGIRGLGLSIYDIKWQAEEKIPSDLSAIISLTTENPKALLALTAMVPFLADLQIPTDGSVIDIKLPLIPPNLAIKAAVKGQNIVIYSGNNIEHHVANLATEDTSANGLVSMGFNYRKLVELAKINIGTLSAIPNSCIFQQEMLHLFKTMPMDNTFLLDVTKAGIQNKMLGSMDKVPSVDFNIVGNYQLETLNDHCQWESAGIETINKDGTGQYIEKDIAKRCIIFSSTYTWQHTGNQLIMQPTEKDQSREFCSQALEKTERKQYHCYLMNIDDNSFQCLFDTGTEEATLFRYQPI